MGRRVADVEVEVVVYGTGPAAATAAGVAAPVAGTGPGPTTGATSAAMAKVNEPAKAFPDRI